MAAVTAGADAPAAVAEIPPESKAAPAVWSVIMEERFIDLWGTEFVRIEQGNFAKHNWKSITDDINKLLKEDEQHFTVQQCKSKIDSLKKRYTTEFGKKTSTGSVNSSWVHFERLGPYLRKLPKVSGIPGAVDSGVEKVPSPPRRSSEEEEFEQEGMRDPGWVPEEAQNDDEQVNNKETPSEKPSSTEQASKVEDSVGGSRKRTSMLEAEDETGDDCKMVSPLKYAGKAGVNGQLNSKGRGNKLFKASPSGTTAMSRSLDLYKACLLDPLIEDRRPPQVGGIMASSGLSCADAPEDPVIVTYSLQ
ncbi:hypothetical protein KFL_010790010 [Klebsormidium nitens]|uniref:Myb/SANT-like DNA-binding domain-containing protein n=1 Tax=Klebsormidium nitens TaxID=105231 RepID=A0A1Y1IP04_KLENI|nr:hypothetical protein KFL_010790010 [Klebsormidium nitens]|eukprot:GAQ92635.1 hypothetical protein KFL_010790010 [Klebsormidium nitens]